MPIYEYACGDCRRTHSLLILNIHNPPPLRCPHCGGGQLDRLLSRFARLRTDERPDQLTDPSHPSEFDEEDFEPMMDESLREEEDLEATP